MDPTLIAGAVTSVLTLVQGLIPLLGAGGASISLVSNIIAALVKIIPVLEQVAPLIGDEATLLYQGVKNIINNLKGDSVTTTAQQDADLDALDARVDASWDKVASQFDPDFLPPGGPAPTV